MAKAVADVDLENQGGFASSNGNITGFSHMHDSGTGGSPSLGDFPLFPQAGCPGDDVNACKFTQTGRATPRVNGTARASPGYFAVSLGGNGISQQCYCRNDGKQQNSSLQIHVPQHASNVQHDLEPSGPC